MAGMHCTRVMEPLLIWGAGGIGATIGAFLERAGQPCLLVDVDTAHVAAMNADGLRVEGPVAQFHVPVRAALPGEVRGVFSRALLCVKGQHTVEACRQMAPHLAPDGFAASFQNGLCERLMAPVLGEARVIGAFVNFGADWQAPGRVMLGNRGAVVLGEVDGAMTTRLAALHETMRLFEPDAIMTPEIFAYLWGKLCYSSYLFAQALAGRGIAETLARPELLGLWRRLAGEVLAVAAAEGVTPLGFNGFVPAAFGPAGSEAAARASVADMVAFNAASAKSHSGVWRDIWVRGRVSAARAQILPVAEIGAGHGIPCPTLIRLVAMIGECETRARPMSDDNLLELAA